MPILNVQMMRPHPTQAEIIESLARFRVLACGRRYGKTELGIFEMAHRAIKGQQVAYFAPTYKMTQETWRQLWWRLHEVITHASKTEGRMELVSGGSIDMWSLSTTSAESVRGRKYHFVMIDEAGMVVDLKVAWDEIIRPLLVDYKGGALFASTPKGRNYFYDLYMRGLNGAEKEWAAWNFPSISNPYVSADEIESARRTTVDRSFRQEYLAEFVEDAGSVFRNVGPVSILPDNLSRNPNDRYVMGVDWGRDIDFTAISVLNVNTMQQVCIDRFNQIGWSFQRGRIRALYDKWQPTIILAERNSIGDPNIEALQAEDLPVQPFITTAASKPSLIEGLALAIERGEITLQDDEYQKHELRAYTMTRMGSGYSYNAPVGGHDDTVIATALSLWAAHMGVSIAFRQGIVKGRH